MLTLGEKLNPRWDGAAARSRLERLGIPMDRPIGKLSGGQQAQVALAMAVGKRPDLLVLDEPLASLDPLARREFLRALTDAATESDVTVLLSSHIIGDLERVCDYLVILAASRIQLAGDIDEIRASHRALVGPAAEAARVTATLTSSARRPPAASPPSSFADECRATGRLGVARGHARRDRRRLSGTLIFGRRQHSP